MHQFLVEYRIDGLDDIEQLNRLREELQRVGSGLYEGPSGPGPWDFGVKFERLTPPSWSTHDVIVRAVFPRHVQLLVNREENIFTIRNCVLTILTSYGHHPGTTVGVSIGYGDLDWCAGSVAH